MGKGDKKTRRGKIFLGTYGVRRRRNKINKPEIKREAIVREAGIKEKKPLKEKKEVKPVREVKEVVEVITPVEA